MALGVIKNGEFGRYYSYMLNGVNKNLSLRDQALFMTPEQLDELISNQIVEFEHNGVKIKAKLVNYFNEKYKKESSYIEFTSDSDLPTIDDETIINRNIDQFIEICANNNDYYTTINLNKYLQSLHLSATYSGTVIETIVPNCYQLLIFKGDRSNFRNPKNRVLDIYLYGEKYDYYKHHFKQINNAEYTRLQNIYDKRKETQAIIETEKLEAIKWINSIIEKLDNKTVEPTNLGEYTLMIKLLEPIVIDVPKTVFEYYNYHTVFDYNYILTLFVDDTFDKYFKQVGTYVNDDTDRLTHFKAVVLTTLRYYYDTWALRRVSLYILNAVISQGLESVVSNIDVSIVLDKGIFLHLRQVLLKKPSDVAQYICCVEFESIYDVAQKHNAILTLLKAYHVYTTFPKQYISQLTTFIIQNEITDFDNKLVNNYDCIINNIRSKNKYCTKSVEKLISDKRFDLLETLGHSIELCFDVELPDDVDEYEVFYDGNNVLDKLRSIIPICNSELKLLITDAKMRLNEKSFMYIGYSYINAQDYLVTEIENTIRVISNIYNRMNEVKLKFIAPQVYVN